MAGRFVTALWPGGPPAKDEAWALGALLAGEQRLWRRMSGPDRRHGVAVARRAVELLGGGEVPREVVAAALLHDVGKVEASLGTVARVGVTIAAIAFGRERLVADRASVAGRGWRRRAALYLSHDSVGARLLRQVGSHELTVRWAEQHHVPPSRWSIDPEIGRALKTADGD